MQIPHSSLAVPRYMGRIPVEMRAWEGAEKLRYDVQCSQDVDAHAQTISQWAQQYDQLSQGRFRGLLRQMWMDEPRIQIFHERTAQQTSQRCLPWHGSIWFGVPDGEAAMSDLRFCGRPQPHAARLLLTARSGEAFSLRTPQDFGIYGVVLDENWLRQRQAQSGQHASSETPAFRATLQATLLQPRTHLALCETIESMLRLGAAGDAEQPWGRAALHALFDHLLELLCTTRQNGSAVDCVPATQRRLQMVMDARSAVMRPGNRDLSVDDLCGLLHVTRRTLQNHFQSAVGVSPLEFLKAVRLNACRRALRTREIGTSIQEIAGAWGFSHMGHFSQDYRILFGERPSQTLRQA